MIAENEKQSAQSSKTVSGWQAVRPPEPPLVAFVSLVSYSTFHVSGLCRL